MADWEKIVTETQLTLDMKHKGQEAVVVSIDIGCTNSAVSLAFLTPDQAPIVRMVKRWPGQARSPEEAKTPTAVAYKAGTYVTAGFRALELEREPEYVVAKLFKPLLHPENRGNDRASPVKKRNRGRPPRLVSRKVIPAKRPHPDIEESSDLSTLMPPLPRGVSLSTIYSDFLRFLFQHSISFLDHVKGGKDMWEARKHQRIIVFTTPNGWSHAEQEFLRDVAIHAGLVSEQDADRLLEFVTESEASVHFMLSRSDDTSWLRPGSRFAVVDVGGSTVDSTLYRCIAAHPELLLEEVPGTKSLQAGGIFIDHEARMTLVEKLGGSKHYDSLNYMVERFERGIKRVFDGTQACWKISFGAKDDDDSGCDIKSGIISLSLFEMRSTFDNTVRKVVNSCRQLCRGKDVEYIILVGGFGECLYLREQLRDTFANSGTEVVTIESPTKKAAAEGATIWFIRQLVVARAARFTLGTEICPIHEPNNPIHQQRPHKVYQNAEGVEKICGIFDLWIKKDDIVQTDFQKTISYRNVYRTRPDFVDAFSIVVYRWDGTEEGPVWCHMDNGRAYDGDELTPHLHQLCRVTADLTDILTERVGSNGQSYWQLEYEVAVLFGGTKLQARLQWCQEGQVHSGPVTVFHKSTIC